MAESTSNTIIELIRQVKLAVRNAEERHPDKKLNISKVELEIKTSLKKEVSAGGKIKWLPVPIELSSSHKKLEVQTISMTLVPERGIVLMGTVADDLADAIDAIRSGVEEAAESPPEFAMKESSVELNFSTTTNGKIALIVSGGADMEYAHKLKLTLT